MTGNIQYHVQSHAKNSAHPIFLYIASSRMQTTSGHTVRTYTTHTCLLSTQFLKLKTVTKNMSHLLLKLRKSEIMVKSSSRKIESTAIFDWNCIFAHFSVMFFLKNQIFSLQRSVKSLKENEISTFDSVRRNVH